MVARRPAGTRQRPQHAPVGSGRHGMKKSADNYPIDSCQRLMDGR
jgi:hypothetical protein